MTQTTLTARGLGRTVGARTLFHDLDLDVHDGLLWIRGPSGCGKSELLRRIAGLVDGPGQLALDVDGTHTTPEQQGWPAWRASVAWVPQTPPRFELPADTLLQQVSGLRARAARPQQDAKALAHDWGVPHAAWDAPLHTLSGGEAQRVWLAIVLAGNPDVVLLDEPVTALDPASSALVEAALAGRTGLLVTHDAAFGERLASRSMWLGDPP